MEKYCPRCFEEFDDSLERCPDDGTTLVSAIEENLVGQELDERYKILSKLGQGGMGVVYIAEQAMIGRQVALKVLRMEMARDKASVQRFLTEAKAIASLKNSHTITLHDFGITSKGLLYYTMELLEGAPLSKLIKQDGPMPHERAAELMLQVLESLDEAHSRDILHRDIKPDNIFITEERGREYATVLDFGIAKLVGDQSMETITRTGMICGTPAYLSPEQALGNQAVPASDLYSLGIVFYEMLAGIPPFYENTPMKVLLKHLNQRPDPIHIRNPRVEVPASFDAFLQKALEKEPENRFRDVVEFRDGLRSAMATHEQTPETVNLSPMSTSQDGIRAITADYRRDSDTSTQDLIADTRHRETPESAAGNTVEKVSPAAAPVTESTAAGRPASPAPMAQPHQTEGNTASAIAASGVKKRQLPWRFLAPVLTIFFILGFVMVWQPWLGSGDSAKPADEKANLLATLGADVSDTRRATPRLVGDVQAETIIGTATAPDIAETAGHGVATGWERESGGTLAADVTSIPDSGPAVQDGPSAPPIAPTPDVTTPAEHNTVADATMPASAAPETMPTEAPTVEEAPKKKADGKKKRGDRKGTSSSGSGKKSMGKKGDGQKESSTKEPTEKVEDSVGEPAPVKRMGFRSVEEEPANDEKIENPGSRRMGFRPVESE